MSTMMIFGFGIGTSNKKGELIEAYFPNPGLLADGGSAATHFAGLQEGLNDFSDAKSFRKATEAMKNYNSFKFWELDKLAGFDWDNPRRCLFFFCKSADSAPESIAEVYLKLHLLSARKAKPHELDLNGAFKVLRNLAWTNRGPVDLDELDELRLDCAIRGETLDVASVDKFPKMTDYVTPPGIRIADTARVRLGAYVGEGTTVMHEGFINFNAGTEGPNMVEGRVSAGVFVGSGSDLGGGCSTMGTLSGGGNVVISVGKNCLIGANAGIGIPLGDHCVVEAGLYITSGTVVTVLDSDRKEAGTLKAFHLASKNNLLFRRNSQLGRVECLTSKNKVELNSDLHLFNQ